MFKKEKKLICKIQEIISNCKNPVLRCKKIDYSYYKKLLVANKVKCNLEQGDLDKEEYFSISNKVFVMYFSSALIEANYSDSEAFMSFQEDEIIFCNEVSDEAISYLSKPSREFIEKYFLKSFLL